MKSGGIGPMVAIVLAIILYVVLSRRRNKTRIPISAAETCVHVVLTLCTLFYWSPVWAIRASMGRRFMR